MYPVRATVGEEIVVEFFKPYFGKKKQCDPAKVIIFCSGMPSIPSAKKLMNHFSKKGYWFFVPRYRGTWESGGEFLKNSPEEDIKDLISVLDNPIEDAFTGNKIEIPKEKEFIVIGSSFGGAAALLVSSLKKVKKVITVSGVVDWDGIGPGEPPKQFKNFVDKGFGEAYRCTDYNWDRLIKGEMYNPVKELEKIEGKKILMIHAQDDDVVLFDPVQKLAKKVGAKFIKLKKGGHVSSRVLLKWNIWRKVKKHLNS